MKKSSAPKNRDEADIRGTTLLPVCDRHFVRLTRGLVIPYTCTALPTGIFLLCISEMKLRWEIHITI